MLFATALAQIHLTSCDGTKDLDREKAKSIIQAHFKFPQVRRTSFECGSKSMHDERFAGPLRQLQKAGLITMQETTWWGHRGTYYRVFLTPEGKRFEIQGQSYNPMRSNSSYVVSHTVDVREVTGIKFNEEKTEAQVEYLAYVDKVTPFGEFAYGGGLAKAREGEVVIVNLELFDDGWRVAKDKRSELSGDVIGGFDQFKQLFESRTGDSRPESESVADETELIGDAEYFGEDAVTIDNAGRIVHGKYPYASIRRLTEKEVQEATRGSRWEIELMRNEIFARHGYVFKRDDLKNHFSSQSWYAPRLDNVDALLSEVERANVALIKRLEK